MPRYSPISAKMPNRVSVIFRRNLFISRLRAPTYINSRLVIQVYFSITFYARNIESLALSLSLLLSLLLSSLSSPLELSSVWVVES